MTDENTMCSSCKSWKELIKCGLFFGLGLLYGIRLTSALIAPLKEEKEEEEEN